MSNLPSSSNRCLQMATGMQFWRATTVANMLQLLIPFMAS